MDAKRLRELYDEVWPLEGALKGTSRDRLVQSLMPWIERIVAEARGKRTFRFFHGPSGPFYELYLDGIKIGEVYSKDKALAWVDS